MNTDYKTLFDCIKDRYIKVVWTHKIHEKQSDIYDKYIRRARWAKIILSSLTVGGVITLIKDVFGAENSCCAQAITALFATSDAVVSMICNEGKWADESSANKRHAAKLHDLRNRYNSLLTDIVGDHVSITDIIKRREYLEKNEDVVYKDAPHTTPKAVKAAEKALKVDLESTSTTEEETTLLPSYLRNL